MAVPVVDGRIVVGAGVEEKIVPVIVVVEDSVIAALVKVVEGEDRETVVVIVEEGEIEVPDGVVGVVTVDEVVAVAV
jgi:cytidine deaminase